MKKCWCGKKTENDREYCCHLHAKMIYYMEWKNGKLKLSKAGKDKFFNPKLEKND